MFKCKQCGETFDNRKDLGKHIYHHRTEAQAEEPVVIPKGRLDELKYVPVGNYARVTATGVMREDGLELHTIEMK